MARLSRKRWMQVVVDGGVILALVAAALVVYKFVIKSPDAPPRPVGCTVTEYDALTAPAHDGFSYNAGSPNASLAQTPPMGFSSYAHFGSQVNEGQIVGIVNAMATDGLRRAGYQYIDVDDGWQGPRVHGQLTSNIRFPCGMKLLGDFIHARGFKFGLYTTPAQKSCAGYPGSAGHVTQDVDTFASWGVDAIKLDWCSASYRDAQSITRQWHDAILNSGRPMLLGINAGGNPWTGYWAKYLAQTWRTSDDICPSWYNKTRPHAAGATACYGRQYQSGVYDYLTTSDTQANAKNVGPGHWADPDSLEAGNTGLTLEEAKTQFMIWSMWSAPLIIGADPRQLPPQFLTLLTNPGIIAIDQDRLGAMAYKLNSSAGEQVWLKELAGRQYAVAVVNLQDTPQTETIHWSEFGLVPAQVTDVWSHTRLPDTQPDMLRVRIPAHGTELLRIRPRGA